MKYSNVQDRMPEKQEGLDLGKLMSSSSSSNDDWFGLPQIMIVGCGGAGCNTVNRVKKMGVKGAATIAINTDKVHLDMIQADKKMLIGRDITRGLGAGGYPEVGQQCAERSRAEIEESMRGADLTFITCGMGGGTGTGAAPIVADVAKKLGAIVIGMVSTPFNVERARLGKADEGIDKLRKIADTVVILDNNRLLQFVPNLPVDQAFAAMDELIAETVKGISETITQPSLINLDYADVKSIMSLGGVGVMLWGEAKTQEGPAAVVHSALSHPLLNVNVNGATGALVHITGGPDLSLEQATGVAEGITRGLNQNANVIWGARILPEFEGRTRVMAIVTGVNVPNVVGPFKPQMAKSAPAMGARPAYTPMAPPAAPKPTNKMGIEWVD